MRILRWIGIAIAALLGIPIVALVVVVALGVALPLDVLRDKIEAVAREALGRAVAIEGPITLVPALSPTLEMRGLRIADPHGWDTEGFAHVDRTRATVALLALVRNEISIDEIAIEGIDVRLESRADGSTNWAFEREPSEAATAPRNGSAYDFVQLGKLAVRALTVRYHDATSGETHAFESEAIAGSLERDGPIMLSARGLVRNQPFAIAMTGGPLSALTDPARPWSLDVTAHAADATLTLAGSIDDPLRAQGIELDIAIRGERLEALESLTGLSIAPIGPFVVKARFARSETQYRLSGLEGAIGNSTFGGDMVIDGLANRPRLTATLDSALLDLAPLLDGESGPSAESSDVARASLDAKDQPALLDVSFEAIAQAFASLQDFDADVALSIDRVTGAGPETRDISLKAKLTDGKLEVPAAVTVADVPLEGRLAIQSSDGALDFAGELSSAGSDIRNLPNVTKRTQDVQGGFEKFNLRASGRGRDLRAALEDLDAVMSMGRVDLSYGHESGGRPVALTLEDFELALPRGQALRVATRGQLLGEAFRLGVTSGTVKALLADAPWPIALSARGAGARLTVKGRVPDPGDLHGTTLDLELTGKRLGDLAPWVGAARDAEAAYAVRGTLSFEKDVARFASMRVKLDQTVVTGELSSRWRGQDRVVRARLRSPAIDPAALANLFSQPQPSAGADDKPGWNLYMPILPDGVAIAHADLDIAVERLRLQPVDVTNLTFHGQFRDGYLKPSPVTATIAQAPFAGRLMLDLRSRVPVAKLNIRSEEVDVGGLLKDLQIIEAAEMTARRLEFNMTLRGSKLETAIRESGISAELEDGLAIFRDPITQAPLEVRVVKGTLSSRPGRPVSYVIDGRIEAIPVTIRIETDPLASFLERTDQVPLRLTADAAGVEVKLSATVPLPVTLDNLPFDFSAEGGRLDSLDELLHVSVPPWGPYALGGTFQLDHVGYHAPALSIRVGDSRLTGNVRLDTTGKRPRVTVNLEGTTLQLNDFKTDGWSAFETVDAAEEAGESERSSQRFRRKQAKTEALLTSEHMRALDARLSLAVNEVLSGSDRLGGGRLVATLENGRLSLDPVRVDIPAGSADARFSLEMTQTDVTAETKVSIERLDYGVLARRIDPKASAAGWLSLDVDLQSRSESLETMMNGASGHFDLAVWPTDMQANIFDLWAANLLIAILPRIDSGSGPVVNCVVGVFDTNDGIMKTKRLLIDTTNVQVSGEGEIDLRSHEVDVLLVPRAKRPTMFSHATPIRISGNYSDLRTGTSPDELVRSAARFVTSILAPIRRLFTTPIPTDGEAACLAAMDRSAE